MHICKTDVDDIDLVNSLDPPAFAAAYIAGSSEADIDGNTAVNAADVTAFLVEYQQATGP